MSTTTAKSAPAVDEAGIVRAPPGTETTVAEGSDYGDEPPRILMALNDAPVQFPEGTVWKGGEAVRHEAANVGAAEIREVLSAVRRRLEDPYDPIWKTQEAQIALWSKDPGGPDERWAQRFSERYALTTYGGPGQAYFGDGAWDAFIFSRAQPRARKVTWHEYPGMEGKKTVTVRKGTTQVNTWQAPEEIEIVRERPKKGFLGDWQDNDDPAISIVGACQQTTSFGAIARGFDVEDDLGYAGYAASEHSGKLPIFTGKTAWQSVEPPEAFGTFYTFGSSLAAEGKSVTSLEEMKAFLDPAYACDPKNVDPPMAPGTIVVYNPHAFLDTVEAMICDFEESEPGPAMKVRATICRAIQGNPGADHPYKPGSRTAPLITSNDVDAWENQLTAASIPMKHKNEDPVAYKARKDVWDKTIHEKAARYRGALTPTRRKLTLPKSVQDPGSHITFVLRVSPEEDVSKRRVQLFDTSSNTAYWVMELQARRGLISRPQQGGIMDGCAFPSHVRPDAKGIPSGSPIVGVGVTPKPDAGRIEAALAAIEKARPVGLVRLALTVRKEPAPPKAPPPGGGAKKKKTDGPDLGPDLFPDRFSFGGGVQKGEIVYVSRLLRMYGDAATQNFYLTRLLWSLRGTPYFSNLQPWWFVFVPVGLFAKAMWAKGAREMRPRDFVKTTLQEERYAKKKVDPHAMPDPWAHRTDLRMDTHYRLTHVLTSTGDEAPPGRKAKGFVWCRMKSALSDGGDTAQKADGYAPPGELLKVMKALGVGDEYAPASVGTVVAAPGDGRAGADPLDWFAYG